MSRKIGFPPLTRTLIYERSAGRCERCDEWASDVQIHHRRPRGMGSSRRPDTNTASNGVLLCGLCHRIVESHREQAYEQGFLVHQGHAPMAIPLLRRGFWVYLRDDGEIIPVLEEAK